MLIMLFFVVVAIYGYTLGKKGFKEFRIVNYSTADTVTEYAVIKMDSNKCVLMKCLRKDSNGKTVITLYSKHFIITSPNDLNFENIKVSHYNIIK